MSIELNEERFDYASATVRRELREGMEVQRNAYLNVKDYEASKVSDDWAPAIQAALDEAAPSGGMVFIPARNDSYTIASSIVVPDNVSLLGEGIEKTKLRLKENASLTSRDLAYPIRGGDITTDPETDTTENIFSVIMTDPAGTENCWIGGFSLDMNVDAQTDIQVLSTATLFGVHVYNSTHAYVHDVYLSNGGTWGMTNTHKVSFVVDHRSTHSRFHNIRGTEYSYEGLLFANGSDRAYATAVDVRSVLSDRYGIAGERATNITVDGFVSKGEASRPLHLAACINTRLLNGLAHSDGGSNCFRCAHQAPSGAFAFATKDVRFTNVEFLSTGDTGGVPLVDLATAEGTFDFNACRWFGEGANSGWRKFGSISNAKVTIRGGYAETDRDLWQNPPQSERMVLTGGFKSVSRSRWGVRCDGPLDITDCEIVTESTDVTYPAIDLLSGGDLRVKGGVLKGARDTVQTEADGKALIVGAKLLGDNKALVNGSSGKVVLRDCDLTGHTGTTPMSGATGADLILRNNEGYVTENRGTGQITTGNTQSADIAHGLDYTPDAEDFTLTPLGNLGSASYAWVSNITATNFRLNSDADPAATAEWKWEVARNV